MLMHALAALRRTRGPYAETERLYRESLAVKEALAMAIKEIVEEKAGSSFAFPSQSVYIESLPGEVAEVFEVPMKKK